MKDTENPFCLHRFASFSSTVADTIRFAHKIPPVHGYDRYQSLNMKMRPEMFPRAWCEISRQYRMERYRKPTAEDEAQMKKKQPDGESDPTAVQFASGHTVTFRSACSRWVYSDPFPNDWEDDLKKRLKAKGRSDEEINEEIRRRKDASTKIDKEGGNVGQLAKEDRYDCGRTIIGSNFMAIFPTFVKNLWKYQEKLGYFLEVLPQPFSFLRRHINIVLA